MSDTLHGLDAYLTTDPRDSEPDWDALEHCRHCGATLDAAGWCDTDDCAGRYQEEEMAKHVTCECGQATGVACEWSGPARQTVVIEWMPPYLRASHEAARNYGSWPHNGAVRLRVERSCAVMLSQTDGDHD